MHSTSWYPHTGRFIQIPCISFRHIHLQGQVLHFCTFLFPIYALSISDSYGGQNFLPRWKHRVSYPPATPKKYCLREIKGYAINWQIDVNNSELRKSTIIGKLISPNPCWVWKVEETPLPRRWHLRYTERDSHRTFARWTFRRKPHRGSEPKEWLFRNRLQEKLATLQMRVLL